MSDHEKQGSGYDPGAAGFELQGRAWRALWPENAERAALISLIMHETTDKIVADGWDVLGTPNILVQGCKYARRGMPAIAAEGYADPQDAARKFAGFIADAFLSTLVVVRQFERKRCAEAIGNMRQSEAGLIDEKHSGQRGCDRSDALFDAYRAIYALPDHIGGGR